MTRTISGVVFLAACAPACTLRLGAPALRRTALGVSTLGMTPLASFADAIEDIAARSNAASEAATAAKAAKLAAGASSSSGGAAVGESLAGSPGSPT